MRLNPGSTACQLCDFELSPHLSEPYFPPEAGSITLYHRALKGVKEIVPGELLAPWLPSSKPIRGPLWLY